MLEFQEFEIGHCYTWTPHKDQKVNCLECGADVWYVLYARILVYKGFVEGAHYFEHPSPPLCPSCGRLFTYHKEYTRIDVTQEFEAIKKLDK